MILSVTIFYRVFRKAIFKLYFVLVSVPLLLLDRSHQEWPLVSKAQTVELVRTACRWDWLLSWTSEISCLQQQKRRMQNRCQKRQQTQRGLTASCPIPILSFPKSQRLPHTPLRLNAAQSCLQGKKYPLRILDIQDQVHLTRQAPWTCRFHYREGYPSIIWTRGPMF